MNPVYAKPLIDMNAQDGKAMAVREFLFLNECTRKKPYSFQNEGKLYRAWFNEALNAINVQASAEFAKTSQLQKIGISKGNDNQYSLKENNHTVQSLSPENKKILMGLFRSIYS